MPAPLDLPQDDENMNLPADMSLNPNAMPGGPPSPMPKGERHPPQKSVNLFWTRFYSKYPGKVFTVLPENPYAEKKIAKAYKGVAQAQRAVRSYEQAREECLRDVQRIVRECRRVNQKYRDPHFDLEGDLKKGQRYCLEGLHKPEEEYCPKAVKRVTDIFEAPKFFTKNPTLGDVIQGQVGDCYMLAALCSMGSMHSLIHKLCIIQDQAVGVYGFVFHRDGEWQQCIIDDQLYLTAPDYDESNMERIVWDSIARRDAEEEYRRTHQTGSRALYFAKSRDANETWLPLIEKAYAKAHGDYASICGGWTGEAVEDLTGGISSEIRSTDILDKEEFWREQLSKVGKEFLFGCSTGQYADWLEPNRPSTRRQGIYEGHAYSLMDAVEHTVDGITYRLVKVRNPWGNNGWTGAWSDGSAEWTGQWMERLDHRFGDNGVFWMTYADLLKKFQRLDRTRIFGDDWKITQQWTSLHIPWSADYHQPRFSVKVAQTTPVVIVLSQLDKNYFAGLEGQYEFKLQFRVQREGDDEDYIVRSNADVFTSRSVSTDITLEAGSYLVLMKITATRYKGPALDKVIAAQAESMREKLIQVGLSYDIAHAKGVIVETEEEQEEREVKERTEAEATRNKRKSKVKECLEKQWKMNKKAEKRMLKREAKAARRAAKRQLSTYDGHQSNQPGQDVYGGHDIGGQNISCGRSFTGDFISSYVHSNENFSPINAGNGTYESSIDDHCLTPPSVSDDTTDQLPPTKPIEEDPPTPKVQVNGIDAITDVKPLKRRPAPLVSRPKASPLSEGSSSEVIVPTTAGPTLLDREYDSDDSSVFSWDTNLDFDSSDERGRITSDEESDLEDNEDPVPGSEPWNAVCVVGLRVYSKDPDLEIKVVRPNPVTSSGKRVFGAAGGTLDRDDPAKGALVEKWVKTPMRESFDLGWGSAVLMD